MTGFLLHIFLSSLCLTFVYGFYILVLRNKINFTLLRYYLLGGIMISLILPLSDYSIDSERVSIISIMPVIKKSSGIAEDMNSFSLPGQGPEMAPENKRSVPWWRMLFITYLVVSLFLFLKIIRQIMILIRYSSMGGIEKIGSCRIIRLKNQDLNFSFFKWIFLGGNLKPDEEDPILQHEYVHASQGHTFDLILGEVMICLMWFNPIIWLYRNEIQLNNEYIADFTLLRSGTTSLTGQR